MNIIQEFDTIAAPATPMGAGGVGIIRISGEKAFEIIDKIFTNPNFEPHKFKHGWIVDNGAKVAMFLKITFLESKERLKFFKEYPPKSSFKPFALDSREE